LSKLVWAMIAIAAPCGACTIVYASVNVGPAFKVKVEDRGHPVKGLRVEIKGYAVVTDENGLALFHDVGPGSYFLTASDEVDSLNGAALQVSPDGPTGVTVPLNWPSITPVAVRSLKGTMRGPDFLPGQSQPRLSLDLLEARSGRKLKSLQSNDRGEFDFETTAPGMYLIALNPSGLIGWSGEQIRGQIVVDVDQGAPTDSLDLDLTWSSCGLGYSDRGKCPKRDLQTEQLSGQVVDPTGAIIPGAKILLLDAARVRVEEVQSDEKGEFASSRRLAGTYDLVVSRPGFTPYRGTVHAESNGQPTRRSPFTVQLGLFGSCAAASLR